MPEYFKKQIAIPQDHGSWIFLLSPLLIGIFAGGKLSYATLYLTIAAMSAFLIRQPLTVLVKVISARRPKTDLNAARIWLLIYGVIASLALLGLILEGFSFILLLVIPGIPVFIWHLWLVSKRDQRKQANIEIIATGALSLAAPAAYWIGTNTYHPIGLWIWALCWLQAAASIIYTYLRLNQRDWKSIPNRWNRFRAGWRAYLYTSFNLFVTALLGIGTGFLPQLIFLPFLLQWLESIWGIENPAIGLKPTMIGIRQLIISTVWTILFIVCWNI